MLRRTLNRLGRHPLPWLTVLALMSIALSAPAFDPAIHETATEAVLSGEGFDVPSADEVGDSNYYTDWFESTSDAAHADNNQLAATSQRLTSKRTAIGDALNACKRRNALDAFGEALHTVQDIYAHSNAVDNGHAIPDLLGMTNGTAPCSLPDFAPAGLVSGYFSTWGFATGNQCRGMPATMCCHRDLNKDNPDKPNGARHPQALAAARTATGTYLGLVEDDIRARFPSETATQLLKMFKKRQRTTIFVIDDTGSMGNDIAGVKSAVNSFLDSIVAGDEAPTLGLVTFKDSVNDRGLTCDIATLRSQVNSLYASGGGDCPEASNSALKAALVKIPANSSDMQLRGGRVLLATDASAGDRNLGPLVAAEAANRGVSIDAILTGDCAAEEDLGAGMIPGEVPFSDNGEDEDPAKCAAAFTKAVDPLTSRSARTQLRALTGITGGVLFNVTRYEVDDVVPTLLELGNPDSAILLSRNLELSAGTPWEIEVPVDDSFTGQVTFMVTASRAGILPAVTALRPSGIPASPDDPDVTLRQLSSVISYVLSPPETGLWRIRLEGAGSFIFRAFGGTPFRLTSVRLQEEDEQPMRPEYDLKPISGQPVRGSLVLGDLRFTATPFDLGVRVRALDGTFLEELAPEPLDGERRFRVSFTVPEESFVIEATGLTDAGQPFVRQTSVPVAPQLVGIDARPPYTVATPETSVPFEAEVFNAASESATFRLVASSSLPWSVDVPPAFTLEGGASALLTVTVNVPASALEGQLSQITLLIENLADSRVRNSSSVRVQVQTNQPPDCSLAEPSAATLWPPNHRFESIDVGGVTDPDGDTVTLSIVSITQDEPVWGSGQGDGNTAPDGDGIGTSTAVVRSERSGQEDGRVYGIGFEASDGNGGTCTGTVFVGVPHDKNGTAVDSGQLYDSTASP